MLKAVKPVKLTLDIEKVMFFEERWMGESTDSHVVLGQLVAYVWCAEAVANASKPCFCTMFLVSRGDCCNPFWHRHICKSRVFSLPGLVVKGRISIVVSILTVLPYRILPEF